MGFAISVRREGRLLIAKQRETTFNRLLDPPRLASSRPCRRLPSTVLILNGSRRHVRFVTRAGEHTE
jgi:hypothetical protein